MIETDPVALRFVVVMLGFLITVTGMIIGFWKVGNKAGAAADNSQEAADLSRPTGNGYAGRTEDGLAEIKKMMTEANQQTRESLIRIETKVDGHLSAHATADVNRI